MSISKYIICANYYDSDMYIRNKIETIFQYQKLLIKYKNNNNIKIIVLFEIPIFIIIMYLFAYVIIKNDILRINLYIFKIFRTIITSKYKI